MSNFITNFITKHISPEYREKLRSSVLRESTNECNNIIERKVRYAKEDLRSETKDYSKKVINSVFGVLSNDLRVRIQKDTKEQVTEQVNEEVNIMIEKFKSEMTGVITTHEIIKPSGEKKVLEGVVVHEKFDTVLKLVQADLPVFMSGPAGSGKNVICKQVAEALDLDFHFTNAVTQEYRLTGFIDAMGKYHETEFYRAFKFGGVFFLDEMDASIPEVLVILNAAIANRYFEFPCGKIDAHPNFRIVAAGNTFGTGADNTYTGRYCLDGASLDRFSVVEIDYSKAIEKYITNFNTDLIDFCEAFRKVTRTAKIDCIFSYRALSAITKLEGKLGLKDIFRMCVTKGIKGDDLGTIKTEIRKFNLEANKYVSNFLEL